MPDDILETVYQYIRGYITAHHGTAPSQREIAAGCYINVAYVARYLDLLEARGRLERERGRARSIHLVEEGALDV
jgi:DNA-binding MarR family transcriptional regulator